MSNLEPMSGRRDFLADQGGADNDRQFERIGDAEIDRRHLLRLQAGALRLAVARRDRRRDHQPHPSAFVVQRLDETDFEHDIVARFQIAEIRGVQPVAVGLQHHRKIALGERRFVLPFGVGTGHHLAFLAHAGKL